MCFPPITVIGLFSVTRYYLQWLFHKKFSINYFQTTLSNNRLQFFKLSIDSHHEHAYKSWLLLLLNVLPFMLYNYVNILRWKCWSARKHDTKEIFWSMKDELNAQQGRSRSYFRATAGPKWPVTFPYRPYCVKMSKVLLTYLNSSIYNFLTTLSKLLCHRFLSLIIGVTTKM
jgi:hypothetical protein